jgi:hypothetical protein
VYVVGADLGQAQDHTALAAVEHVEGEIHLRHLERLPLGTTYPATVARIVALVQSLPEPGEIVIDATGVGRPVVDMLRRDGLDPVAVTITGGRRIKRADGGWRVPKQVLVRALVVAFEAGLLKIARGLPFGRTFEQELRIFKRRISARGNDTYGAGGAGAHDNLVIAVALACWWDHAETKNPFQVRA